MTGPTSSFALPLQTGSKLAQPTLPPEIEIEIEIEIVIVARFPGNQSRMRHCAPQPECESMSGYHALLSSPAGCTTRLPCGRSQTVPGASHGCLRRMTGLTLLLQFL